MKKLSQWVLKLMGWKIVGSLPELKQYVLIVVPHTSNWDFIVGIFARFALGTKINFLAKKQLFFFPLGNFLRAVGGFSVNRAKKGNLVGLVVKQFQRNDEFKLGITPEGTRGPVARWKEGFYHIACMANVPIVMVGFDYPSKEVRIREVFWPTKDLGQDFEPILAFFRTIHGKYPKTIPDYQPK